jgi:hypothetical protein
MPKSSGRDLLAQSQQAVSIGWGDMDPAEVSEAYTWFHVPAVGALDVVVLSTDPVLYRGHYMAGAVQPCSIPRCVHCQNGVGILKRCALSVYSLSLGARGLLELGHGTAGQIHALSVSAGHLRGLAVSLTKSHDHHRGQIHADAYAGPLEVVELPEEQDPLVPLNAQWAKLALKRRAKDGPGNIQMRGEAAPLTLSLSASEAMKTVREFMSSKRT